MKTGEEKMTIYFKMLDKAFSDDNLPDTSKLVLHKILYYYLFGNNHDFCSATNAHFGRILSKSISAIARAITALVDKEYVDRIQIREAGDFMVKQRKLIPNLKKLGISEDANYNLKKLFLEDNTTNKEDIINNKFISIILSENANQSKLSWKESLALQENEDANLYAFSLAVAISNELPDTRIDFIVSTLEKYLSNASQSKINGCKSLLRLKGLNFFIILVKKQMKINVSKRNNLYSHCSTFDSTQDLAALLKQRLIWFSQDHKTKSSPIEFLRGDMRQKLQIKRVQDFNNIKNQDIKIRIYAKLVVIKELPDKFKNGTFFAEMHFSSVEKSLASSSQQKRSIGIIDSETYMPIRGKLKQLQNRKIVFEGFTKYSPRHQKIIIQSRPNVPFLVTG